MGPDLVHHRPGVGVEQPVGRGQGLGNPSGQLLEPGLQQTVIVQAPGIAGNLAVPRVFGVVEGMVVVDGHRENGPGFGQNQGRVLALGGVPAHPVHFSLMARLQPLLQAAPGTQRAGPAEADLVEPQRQGLGADPVRQSFRLGAGFSPWCELRGEPCHIAPSSGRCRGGYSVGWWRGSCAPGVPGRTSSRPRR